MNAHYKLYTKCDTHSGVDVYSIKLYGVQVQCVLACLLTCMCGNESKPHVNENAKQLFTKTESPWIVWCCILDFDCIIIKCILMLCTLKRQSIWPSNVHTHFFHAVQMCAWCARIDVYALQCMSIQIGFSLVHISLCSFTRTSTE